MGFPFLAAATLGAGALSALSGNSAAKKAAAASQYATDQQTALAREQFNQTQANLSPYMQAGQTGLSTLTARADGTGGVYGGTADPSYTAPEAFSYTAADYQQSPGLQFAIDRGIDAINSNMANKGAMYSGAANKKIGAFVADTMLKDFQNERAFAQGAYTDQRNFDRSNYLDDRSYLTNRYDQQTGVATNLASIGQGAATGVGNAGANYANTVGNALQANAANQGNAGLVTASNFSNLLGTGINALAYTQRPQTMLDPYRTNASYGFS